MESRVDTSCSGSKNTIGNLEQEIEFQGKIFFLCVVKEQIIV